MAVSGYDLYEGDCLDILQFLPDDSVDSIVTDPPYGLSKEPDMAEVLRHWLAGDDYKHKGAGFMGKSWDSFVPGPAVWRECLRVLKPGGHLLSFFGSRTYDMGVLAIRLAGFEIRDQVGWVYGSGFPKSRNVGDGWGTALKPAIEPIVVARKPLTDTVAANVLEHGTGAINIDGCRVATGENLAGGAYAQSGGRNSLSGDTRTGAAEGMFQPGKTAERDFIQPTGRWPANLIHDGSDEVFECFPDAKGQQGDVRGTEPSRTGDENTSCYGEYGRVPAAKRGDAGSAARFFYCAKASKADRNAGCEHPVGEGIAASNQAQAELARGNLHVGGSGTNTAKVRKNNHPTVKPTDLMRYLCRLVTPPGGTVLDPFMGSGSTGRGAILEGFQFIGIEMDADYLAIAKARIQDAGDD